MGLLGAFGGLGGGNLGNAVGSISIDTSGVRQGKAVVIDAARGIERAMDTMGRNTDRALNRMGQNLQGISAGMGLIAAGGLAAAQRVQRLEAMFRIVSGSEERAVREMNNLRQMAERTGQPFLQLVEGAAGLLPAIRRSNAELTKTLSVAQRLAILDPAQGIAGASFAIREFLSGEYLSLQRRFELDRGRLREIIGEAGGDVAIAIEGLSAYIDEIGLTEDALTGMAQTGLMSFAQLGDEVQLTLADAFSPFLNEVLIPIVSEMGKLARAAREANPDLLALAGTLAAVIGLPSLARRIPGIGGLIPGIGHMGLRSSSGLMRYAGAGLAVTGGLVAAQGIGQAITEEGTTERQAFEGSLGDVAGRAVATVVTALAMAIGKAGEALTNFHFMLQAVGLRLSQAFADVEATLGHFIAWLAGRLNVLGLDTSEMAMAGVGMVTHADTLRNQIIPERAAQLQQEHAEALAGAQQATEEITASVAEFAVGLFGGQDALDRFNNTVEKTARVAEEATDPKGGGTALEFSEDMINAWLDFQDELSSIETEYADARAQALIDKEQKLTDALDQKATDRIVREEEASIALGQRIADLQAENEQRTTDTIQKFQVQRERDLRKHHNTLLGAAAGLDAEAVWREQIRFREEETTREENRRLELAKLDEQLEQQIAREVVANERRLEAAERADERYLVNLEQRLEDEYQLRLQQLAEQEDAERQLTEEAFIATFNAIAQEAGNNAMMIGQLARAGYAEAEAALRAYWQTAVGAAKGSYTPPSTNWSLSGIASNIGTSISLLGKLATSPAPAASAAGGGPTYKSLSVSGNSFVLPPTADTPGRWSDAVVDKLAGIMAGI